MFYVLFFGLPVVFCQLTYKIRSCRKPSAYQNSAQRKKNSAVRYTDGACGVRRNGGMYIDGILGVHNNSVSHGKQSRKNSR